MRISDWSSDVCSSDLLSWPALRPDDGTADAFHRMSHADSAATFREALRQFHSPQQNVVFADVAGNIGFAAPARVPVRRSGNGQHPVPGWSGEFDWIGFVPFEELPASSNPRSALIINAKARKSGVRGKSGSVRVYLGVRRIIKKTTNTNYPKHSKQK